ncbi:MAG: GNAT family N-acetyltransferase [Kordiimonadaceae bacterium]|nr:GNAT family N-acetyltransferase [Kordiimonadaceae bacterium]MBO6567962.1 GNAT family N-acetyltransferase [Kordiimonadaceae bacterium]MBO6964308.1 GNAT family N-acetyltransferase [Kordiimonadaceae bacterium]
MYQSLANWQPCEEPGANVLEGQYCRLEPYRESEHLTGLFAAICGSQNVSLWDYIPMGPFKDEIAFAEALAVTNAERGWRTMVICRGEDVLGMASFMRIREVHGSAEVGCVVFSPKLQRTREASEAIYLFGKHLFDDLGYRRFEWKCNNANEASKRAAIRFGFQFEGVFRNDMVVKGVSRDTAWYAVTDADWPNVSAAFSKWLNPANFDEKGQQIGPLKMA